MSYKIPDSMQKAFKSNAITYIAPELKVETEPQPDGSTKVAADLNIKDFAYAMSVIVQQMNEAFDDAIIKEFAASNGYVKKRTCYRITGLIPCSEFSSYCSECGNHLFVDDVYCSKCGAEIND